MTLNLNSTPSANRIHISFFGRRNAGKSSLVNAVTGQNLSIVSDTPGTTTDPVSKSMELLPLGPVVITDTAGLDDTGEVGKMRVEKAMVILRKTDIAVLAVDVSLGLQDDDRQLIDLFQERKIPFIVVFNKADLNAPFTLQEYPFPVIVASTLTGMGIEDLKGMISRIGRDVVLSKSADKRIIMDKLSAEDVVVLVTPIDSSAPKGRLILPQVQTIRDILDGHGMVMVVQLEELEKSLSALAKPPALVITDSQVFESVKEIVPESVMLTSFSILFAHYKGILDTAAAGASYLSSLEDGDKVLVSEGCTHHRQCEDIGTVKLPGWIEKYTGKKLAFSFTSGGQFPSTDELKQFSLVIHCGGCMLNEKEMLSRMEMASDAGVMFTNYGILIAHMNGILSRSLEVLE